MKANEVGELQQHKEHHKSKAGKRVKDKKKENIEKHKTRGTNMKAFAIQNVRDVRYKLEKKAQIEYKTAKIPEITRKGEIAPPDMVAVIGPNGCGKTTLVKALIRAYSNQTITDPVGPITVSVATDKRVTLFDVPNSLTAVLDIARVVDLVVLVIDAEKGFQTEHFEYLNVFQAIGFPKIFTVLTHLDQIKNKYFKTRKRIRERIEKEIAAGCKIFEMPFNDYKNTYSRDKAQVLSRCIAQQKYQYPLQWRTLHDCVLVDRIEAKSDNVGNLTCFGYVRGTYINQQQMYHVPGFMDVYIQSMEAIPDPALPDKKLVLQKSKPVLYAPMSEVADIKVDDDAIHVKVNVNERRGKAGQAMQIINQIQQDDNATISKNATDAGIQLFEDGDDIEYKENEPLQHEVSFGEEEEESEADSVESDSKNDWEEDKSNSSQQSIKEASTDDEIEVNQQELLDQAQINNYQIGEEESEAEEIAPQTTDNEQMRIQQILKKLRLFKPDASKQFYQDIIYTQWEKIKHSKPKSHKGTKTVLKQLFAESDDEESVQLINNLEWLPKNYKQQYKYLPFEQDCRDCTKQYPKYCEFNDDQLSVKSDYSKETMQKYFLQDTDYITAIQKCLSQETTVKPEEEQVQKEKDTANPLLKSSIDDAFQKELEKEVERVQQREKLLSVTDTSRFAPGQYVRFQLPVIKEFANNYDRNNPLILGALLPMEDQKEFITCKVKHHRWFPQIMKSRAPITVAVGWRRFQTLPVYSLEQIQQTAQNYDAQLITEQPPLKLLKYTPEHMHCMCTFYGNRVAAGSGIICFQDVTSNAFRVCANGVVMDNAPIVKIYKKLKLVGYVDDLYKNNAFISQMFNSKLEAAAFVGAGVRTVSGIRGIIKKPHDDKGAVRVTFEDKLRKNDIIFLKTYIKVKVDKFCNEWDNHCQAKFTQIKQLKEIRKEKGISIQYNADSVYKQEQRTVFVPQKLELRPQFVQKLPFEQAKEYIQQSKLVPGEQLDEIELQKRRIQNRDLRQLLIDQKDDAKRQKVQQFEKLTKVVIDEKSAKQKQTEYAKEQWVKGMTKKHTIEKEEEKELRRKQKRITQQKLQKKQAKKSKL